MVTIVSFCPDCLEPKCDCDPMEPPPEKSLICSCHELPLDECPGPDSNFLAEVAQIVYEDEDTEEFDSRMAALASLAEIFA